MLKYPVLPLKQHGFTLIELMVTVSILAVIAMIAAPSFTPLIERWRVRSAAEELQSTIYYARSEAIKRGGGVTINATDNADWANGWEVHGIDADGDDELLQTSGASTSLAISEESDATELALDRWGTIAPVADFLLTPANKDENAASATRVCISGSGLIRHLPGGEECNPSTPDPDPDP